MKHLIRSAFVIGRRDFTATVLSKAFIFFLLGPLFPLLLGGLFGGIGAQVANRTEQPVIAVTFTAPDFARLSAARDRIAPALPDPGLVKFVHYAPAADSNAQVRALLKSKSPPIRAVLTGNLDQPRVTGAVGGDAGLLNQLRLTLADARSPQPPQQPPAIAVTEVAASSGSLAHDRVFTAQIGQMLLFFLTVLLSGMLMSQLIEEKSNKIVEVIAAAVPIDAMFLGKLFAMLASSVVGIVVWISAGALLIQTIKHGGVQTLPPPAVGWPAFLALAIIYFAMNYLLLGSVFLTIGAQASTAREVQTLSMPVTFGQVLLFGFASTAIGASDSNNAIIAAIFPLSSPMVMLARAAERPELWPHLVAILWQALWVAVILRIGAQLFRKTVLKSGPRTSLWRRLRRT
ncbi:MAG: ABC transporter permease [Sphingomicrobium sp.]